MSVAWSSGSGGSIVARHEWKGLVKTRGVLEDWVEKRRLESQEATGERQRAVSSNLDSDDDDYTPGSDDSDDD